MFILCSGLGVAVTCNTSHSTFDSASDAIGDATSEVVDLALGFLALTCGVLLLAFLL
jgi:hypothetical protein